MNLRLPGLENLLGFGVAMCMVVFPLSDHMISIKANVVAVEQFGSRGLKNAAMMSLVTLLAFVRYFMLVPGLAFIVPLTVLMRGMQADPSSAGTGTGIGVSTFG